MGFEVEVKTFEIGELSLWVSEDVADGKSRAPKRTTWKITRSNTYGLRLAKWRRNQVVSKKKWLIF